MTRILLTLPLLLVGFQSQPAQPLPPRTTPTAVKPRQVAAVPAEAPREQPAPEQSIPMIDAPAEAKAGRLVVLRVKDTLATDAVSWIFPRAIDLDEYRSVSQDNRTAYLAADPGTLELTAIVARSNETPGQPPQIITLFHTLTLTGPRPPPGPVDPVNPPQPIVTDGFRVLFVYEAQAAMSREQLNILNSTQIIAYLNSHCVKVNGHPEWRKWDKDLAATGESKTWQDIWTAAKANVKKIPSMVIVNGGKMEIFDLVGTEAETLTLLKKYGG